MADRSSTTSPEVLPPPDQVTLAVQLTTELYAVQDSVGRLDELTGDRKGGLPWLISAQRT